MKVVHIHQPGGPEVLVLEEADIPTPGPKEALVRIESIGVNFIDIYHRTGLYPLDVPFILGREAAGTVESVGGEVSEVKAGERVAYVLFPSYAEYAIVPSWMLVPLPSSLSFNTAAALLLQGLTAHYLAHSTFPIQPGNRVLIHAAAGGVGLLLVQIAKALGAQVFGTVSTEAKAIAATNAGADIVIRYTEDDFEEVIKQETQGEGLHVVYDSVGATTFDKSLKCLRPRGMLALYGASSGPVPPFDLARLAGAGSLFITRPTLNHYILNRKELLDRSQTLFNLVEQDKLNITIDQELSLGSASRAHELLEGRKTSGKLLLKP